MIEEELKGAILHVREDQHERFELFIDQILNVAFEEFKAQENCVVKLLRPTMLNDDGTYTYVVVTDSEMCNPEGILPKILNSAFDEQQAREYLQDLSEMLAGGPAQFSLE